MRSLVCLIALSGVAFADVAPPGRYRLDARGPLRLLEHDRSAEQPSCGQRAIDFLSGMDTVRIGVGTDIEVNGTVWPRLPNQVDHSLTVFRDDLLEGFVVEVLFRRLEPKGASGFVVVFGLDAAGKVRCGDGRVLVGRYQR